MRQLPLSTACLDGVWMQASLLHLPREAGPHILAEVGRVLKPGGALYISVKQGDGEVTQDNLAGQPRFFTLYQPDELAGLVSGACFEVEQQWLKETADTTWNQPDCREISRLTPATPERTPSPAQSSPAGFWCARR